MDQSIKQLFEELKKKKFPFVVAVDSGDQVEILCMGRGVEDSIRLATALSEHVMFEHAKLFIEKYEKKMAEIRSGAGIKCDAEKDATSSGVK